MESLHDFKFFNINFQDVNKLESFSRRESQICNFLRLIKDFLSEKGAIGAMLIWLNSWERIHGTVQFQRAHHARRLLEKTEYNLNGGITLYVMDAMDLIEPEFTHAPCQFYVNKRFVYTYPPRKRRGTNILDLNDDCIQEIFESLDVLDLCSVARVCQRFKQNAQKRFGIHHKSFHFFEIATLNADRMKNFFEDFGPFIEKMHVSSLLLPMLSHAGFPDMLIRHFTSLRELTLHQFELDDAIVGKLKPLFVRLKKLSFVGGAVPNAFSGVLPHCHELNKLKFFTSRMNDFNWQPVRLPMLESFSIDGNHLTGLPTFLERNRELKKVELFYHLRNDNENILEIERHTLLEELALSISWEIPRISFLTRMSALRKLKIAPTNYSASQLALFFRNLAAAKIPLEHLELWMSRKYGVPGSRMPPKFDEQIAGAISELKTLKTFCLTAPKLEISRVIQISEHLNELTNLHVLLSMQLVQWDSYVLPNILRMAKNLQRIRLENIILAINVEIYEQILQTARERAAEIPVQIFISQNSMQKFKHRVPQSTIDANKHDLHITSFFFD